MRTDEEKILFGAYRMRQNIKNKVELMQDNISITGIDYSKPKVQTSCSDSVVERQAMKNLKLYEEITELQAEIGKVMKMIDALPDMMERFLLEEYTHHGSWKTSADVYGNPRNFKKAKQTALEHFGEELQNETKKGGLD